METEERTVHQSSSGCFGKALSSVSTHLHLLIDIHIIATGIVQQNITRETVMNQSEGKMRNTQAAFWAGKVT